MNPIETAPSQTVVAFMKPAQIFVYPKRTIDMSRLVKRMGKVDAATLSGMLNVLGEMFRE